MCVSSSYFTFFFFKFRHKHVINTFCCHYSIAHKNIQTEVLTGGKKEKNVVSQWHKVQTVDISVKRNKLF